MSLVVVLDDDPTGTQAASGVTVLFDASVDGIVEALRADGAVYVQTNSRAIDEAAAVALARVLRERILAAEAVLGEPILVVLRGDSTLRGHVFAESDVFADGAGRILLVPAFPGGGRTTIDAVHRVRIDGVDTPVGETEFARDPVFGYRSSNLVEWVAERGARAAVPVPLGALRSSDGAAVADAIAAAAPGEVVVPDVETDADVALIHRGLLAATAAGVPVVVRCAATLAARTADRLSDGLLERPIARPAPAGVLVVCGSHTGAAGAQLARLTAALGEPPVVVPTDAAFADPTAAGAVAAAAVAQRLAARGIAVLASERERRAEDDTLAHGDAVMRALMAAARELAPRVGTIVSKGGITSAEVGRVAFGADRARVRGQVAAGISVFDLPTADGPRVQVVVPGNVGGPDTLVDVVGALAIDGLALDGLVRDGFALDGLMRDGFALDGTTTDE